MAVFYVDNTLHAAANALGTATGGGSGYILLQDAGVQSDGQFAQYGITITSGTGAGQQRRIVDYDHTGNVNGERCATVDSAWATVPGTTSTYEITVGCDVNSGANAGTGPTGAWRTIDHAMDAIAGAGTGPHTIWIRGGRAYCETAVIDTAGAAGRPVILEGYSNLPGDSGMATLDGQSVRSSGLTTSLTGGVYHVFRNLCVENCMGSGIDLALASSLRLLGCVARNNRVNGIAIGQDCVLVGCEATGNLGSGFVVTAVSGGQSNILIGCHARGNGGQQFRGGAITLVFCSASGLANDTMAVSIVSASDGVCLINCTIDGSGSSGATGFYGSAGSRYVVVNSIFSNLRRGIRMVSLDPLRIARNNLFHNCLEGNLTNYASDGGDVLADPAYVDANAGDLRVRTASPALRAGYPASVDIGAFQHCSHSMIGGPCKIGVQA